MLVDNRREYLQTHPWLTFRWPLREDDVHLWMLLGEARSACEQLAVTPLRPDVASELHRIYLVKGALATTAIEGNTLTEDEAMRVLDGSLRLPPSQAYMEVEIQNIVDACGWIVEQGVSESGLTLTVPLVKDLNRRVLDGLELDEGVVPGEYSSHPVGVFNYRGAPRADCDFLMERLVEWLNSPTFVGADDARSRFIGAISRAVAAHLYMAWVHPFGDGNGRTARLLEFAILIASGVPFPAAHLMSNHYNRTRTLYYRQLQMASASGGDISPFMRYAVQGLVELLGEQLDAVKGQHLQDVWKVYVAETFAGGSGMTSTRRQNLVMALTGLSEPVPKTELRNLTPLIASGYASKSEKTVTRDVNELTRMGLIERVRGGFRARPELMMAFLPGRAPTD